jgi:hypothetical protein
MTPIISEYQEGTRNARVYRTASGDYGILLFDAVDDYNDFKSFHTIDEAEDAAEDWVLGYDTI